jgi:hypothetical protein
MSADNGIFIFDHPHGYGLVHETLSRMPAVCEKLISSRKSGLDHSPVFVLSTHGLAHSGALMWRNMMVRNGLILEYGICDFGNEARKFHPGLLARDNIQEVKSFLNRTYG